jgi:thioredoxin-like negative regulator of GroEL
MDLSVTVFDQNSAQSADTSKNYVIFAYDKDSCVGDKAARCQELEQALFLAKSVAMQADGANKYLDHLSFGKANKDDFPDHQKDFEKAKIPLPAVLFWPAGHTRPSCKFDSPKPSGQGLADWMISKVKDEEDDDLLELDEGPASLLDSVDRSVLVCQANGGPNVVAEEYECADLVETAVETQQGLMQLEKTQKIWDAKTGTTKFIGPADNSREHKVRNGGADVITLDNAGFQDLSKQNKYMAIYFHAPWCKYCSCLSPVWDGVSSNLVGTLVQPDLITAQVNGDVEPDLLATFNVTSYPTFVLVDKEGSKVLGRYLGPRKVFELSTWINDLIMASQNPVMKEQFIKGDEGSAVDGHPVFPYDSTAPQALASLETSVGLAGNDFDDCTDMDEAKFTSPGVALLVHYASETNLHALEMDQNTVSTRNTPSKLTVVDFMVSWCPHCQKLNPVWDTISTDFSASQGVAIGKVDLERHPEVKQEFGIHRFPTIMYFEAGKPMTFDEGHRYTGQRDPEHLKQWIEEIQKQHA